MLCLIFANEYLIYHFQEVLIATIANHVLYDKCQQMNWKPVAVVFQKENDMAVEPLLL